MPQKIVCAETGNVSELLRQPCKHYFSETQLHRILINSRDKCRHCVENNSESHKILQRKPKNSMMQHGLLKDNIDHSLKNPNKLL